MENRIASSKINAGARPTAARLITLDAAALLRAFLRARSFDPALAFARVLALAAILSAHAGALALAAIGSYTLHVSLTALAAVLRQHRLCGEHQADHRRQHGSACSNPVHRHPSKSSVAIELCAHSKDAWRTVLDRTACLKIPLSFAAQFQNTISCCAVPQE
jgi:hypothetical protein